MTEPDMDKIEDRIAKLLAKAEKTTPEEAIALTEAAERMMLKYGIEQAIIMAKRAGKTHDADEKMLRVIIPYTGVYAKAMRMAMISAVHAFNTVKIVVDDDKGAKTEYLWLLGYESDVKQMQVLVTSLQLQCISALSTWWKTMSERTTNWTAMEKFKARRTFIVAFGDGAATRIERSRRSVIEESKSSGEAGTELAIRDRRSDVDTWVDSQFDLTSGKRTRMSLGSAGYGAGHKAGTNANTGEGALKQTRQLQG